MILLKILQESSDESLSGSLCIMVSEKLRYGRGMGAVNERNFSMAGRGRAGSADPGESVVAFGTTERAEVRSRSFGVSADRVTSIDIMVDTDLFTVGGTEFAACDLGPGGFTIGKLGRFIFVVVVVPDWVALLTAEDAADRVRLSAA
jgi:hypothetical protein